MIYIYIISFLVFIAIIYFTSGNLKWFLWKWFSKNPGIRRENGCTVYLSDNIPFGLAGRFYPPDIVFVQRSYYTENGKETNLEFIEATPEQLSKGFQGTNDTVQHEAIGHKAQFDRLVQNYGKLIGTIFFYGWGLFNEAGYLLGIYKIRKKMPIEREPEEAEKTYGR